MTSKDQGKLALLALLLWWLYKRPVVTTSLSFPQAPEGQCYDEETDSYYVGDC